MSLLRPAAGGESCLAGFFFMRIPAQRKKPLCVARGAQREEEDESPPLDRTSPCRGKKLLCVAGGAQREEEDESPPLDRTSLCKGKCVMRRTEHAASRGRRIFSTRLIGVKDI